ncbi:MAG: hypothetical protein L6R37_005454 [Teloschistes peruensis]|nr:MAG: hypothetical protein L6R37_005454 [Teloschistes peruensis]
MAYIRTLLLLTGIVLADVQLYPNNTLITSNTISQACHDAMNANLACDLYLVNLATNNYYGSLGDTSLQNSVCDTKCGTALSTYHNSVHQACAQDEDPWLGVPANYYGDLVFAHSISIPGYAQEGTTQPKKCLSGNTYAVVAGDNIQKIAAVKQVSSGALAILNGILPDGSNFQECTNLLSGTNVCVSLPGTAYTGTTIPGATVTKIDIYASATAAPPLDIASGTTRKCGKYYQVQPGDYCQKVAINNTIGTTPQCYEWHVIVSGDYCYKIAQDYDISVAQLQTWNPSLAGDCVVVLRDAYCVSGPSTAGGRGRDEEES